MGVMVGAMAFLACGGVWWAGRRMAGVLRDERNVSGIVRGIGIGLTAIITNLWPLPIGTTPASTRPPDGSPSSCGSLQLMMMIMMKTMTTMMPSCFPCYPI